MKKNFMQKLMAAAILTVAAVCPSWADYTITKSNGEPAVEGTDYNIDTDGYMGLYTNDLVLSGEINVAVYSYVEYCTLTLKDVTITSEYFGGALCYMENTLLTLVLEGTSRLISTSTGNAIHLYNGAKDITFTGSGELYMTSQADEGSCLYTSGAEAPVITAEGFTIKGSKAYNADMSSLADAEIGTYADFIGWQAAGVLIGNDFCNTAWMKGPKAGPDLDPDAEYVIVTYKEGSDTKKAYYKATDVEKIEWLKGADIAD